MGGYSIKDWGAAGASAMALVLAVTVAGNLLVPLPPEPEPGSPDATTASAPAPKPAAKESARPAAQHASTAGPVSLAARLAVADVKRGETVAKKCVACHPLDKDAKAKVGPTLWGVVERKVATGDFKFSEALVKLGGTWTFERLEAYSENPKTFAPGNKMAFGGIANPAERADLLAFLRGRTDAPVPLPQPKPEELAAAKAGAAA
ncbi:MAG: c-type cytochrome, partial [Magnetospirillum sp. WYHS-4]